VRPKIDHDAPTALLAIGKPSTETWDPLPSQHDGTGVIDLAKATCFDMPTGGQYGRGKSAHESNLQHTLSAVAGRDNLGALGHIHGHGLLKEHMPTGIQRSDRQRRVQCIGDGNDYCGHLITGEHLVTAGP
jgi:hypothetical protein